MTHHHSQIRDQFQAEGRVWLRGFIPPKQLKNLQNLSALNGRPGVRISENNPLVKALQISDFNTEIQTLWPGMRPVRLISFDKSPTSNWGVPWHQDRVIAVSQQTDLPGFTNWSCKSGAWHCEPPFEQLQSMLFVRVHLDDNTAQNGAMEIALGSHRAGKVPADRAAAVADQYETEITTAAAGDILILAMLTLHRSLPAMINTGRRALRIDYAPFNLPTPLQWTI